MCCGLPFSGRIWKRLGRMKQIWKSRLFRQFSRAKFNFFKCVQASLIFLVHPVLLGFVREKLQVIVSLDHPVAEWRPFSLLAWSFEPFGCKGRTRICWEHSNWFSFLALQFPWMLCGFCCLVPPQCRQEGPAISENGDFEGVLGVVYDTRTLLHLLF